MTELLAAEAAVEVSVDIGAVVTTVIWVGLLVAVLVLFHRPLSTFLSELPTRVRSLSAAGVTLEFTPESSAKPFDFSEVSGLDLRKAGTPGEVGPSYVGNFYRLMADPTPVPTVLVDLGAGEEWLSSRLYVLAVLLRRMRGVETVVLVEARGGVLRRFVGVADTETVRWRLARAHPRYEAALAAAEHEMWGDVVPAPGAPSYEPGFEVANTDGRLESIGDGQGPTEALLSEFLFRVQVQTVGDPGPDEPWQDLPSSPQVFEQAVWLTGEGVKRVLGDALQQKSVSQTDWRAWSKELRLRAVLEWDRRYVPVTGDDRVFDHLIDRTEVLERIAGAVASDL